MVINHAIPEIHYVILEIYFLVFIYFWNYMADDHVDLETCFTENLQVYNVRITWSSAM
jgi:hypothetical protein